MPLLSSIEPRRPRVWNRHHKDAPANAVYIGRGTPWGNPWIVGVHGDREACCRRFKEETLPHLDVTALRGRDLLCSCKPAECHGDYILEKANRPPRGRYKIHHGDCREIIPRLTARGKKFDLIFADPPFNIDHHYTGFKDKMSWEEYADFTFAWVRACWLALGPRGVLCLHGPDHLAELYIMAALAMTFSEHRIGWVNWHYRFGVHTRKRWIDARCHCLIYSKDIDNHTWNPEAVSVPSDRVAYGDKRIADSPHGGLRVPGTVWGVPSDGPFWGRVQGNSEERRPNHPNQLPELYLARIIKAYTNPGDLVGEPFCGSGTTPVVATALGRDCIAMDVSPENVASARERCAKGVVRDVWQ